MQLKGEIMGVIVHKEQDRNTELNEKITADLRARAQRTSGISNPDLVGDADYVVDTKATSRFGWIWFVLVGLALLSLVAIILV